MRSVVTTLLDTLALLLIAAGAAAGLFPWLGWFTLAVAGGLVLAGSVLAAKVGSG